MGKHELPYVVEVYEYCQLGISYNKLMLNSETIRARCNKLRKMFQHSSVCMACGTLRNSINMFMCFTFIFIFNNSSFNMFELYNYIYVQYFYLHSKHIYSYGKNIVVVKIIRLYSIKSKKICLQ